eukprot:123919-Pelagomonas_calceolata.AAC.1
MVYALALLKETEDMYFCSNRLAHACKGASQQWQVVLKNTVWGVQRTSLCPAESSSCSCPSQGCSGTLSPDAPGQLNVLGHDGDALGVDGCQVGVLKQAHQ